MTPKQADPAAAAPRRTVLVVDDNAASRYALARALQAAGFDTLETGGGAQALELARRQVDAVVLDVHLPDVHGFEVCRLIRSRRESASLPVVHVSAVQVASDDQVSGVGAGADAYLVSPVDHRFLVALLRRLIHAREAEQDVRRNEVRFRAVFDDAGCGMLLVDRDGRIARANPAFGQLIGERADELVGRRVVELAPPDWRARALRAMTHWSDQPWRGQLPLASAAGTVPANWRVSPHVEPGLSIAVVIESATADGAPA